MNTTYSDKLSIGPRCLYAEWSGAGTPVILLEAGGTGAGSWNGAWGPIWNELAGLSRVCRSDRANTGRSDKAAEPRTCQDMVPDLRLMLSAAGFAPPYLLVGHSFGGLVMQLYARRHPDEIAGLVLIDSVHPDQVERFYALSKSAGKSSPTIAAIGFSLMSRRSSSMRLLACCRRPAPGQTGLAHAPTDAPAGRLSVAMNL